ncbi:protein IsiD [Lusitaniella coriacea]|uniref:protein IsiD n=1 Tax=Lusitaniella coriacea TaxID=1983105 RepID=UPI003CF3B7B8
MTQTLSNSKQDLANVTAEEVARLALRLEQDDYENPFEALGDWHLLRAIAFQNSELVEPYLYLLDIEAYDEA